MPGEHGYDYGFGNEREIHPEKPHEFTEEEAFAMATAIAEDTMRMFRENGVTPTRTKSDLVAEMLEIIMPKKKGSN